MAQSGYTPILIYGSGTASAVPTAGNLTSSSNGAELALNYADGKLYFKNSSGVVTLLASSATAGGTSPGGSTTQVQYNNAGAFAGSSNLTFDGTNLTSGGTVTATKLIPTGNVTAGNGMYLPTTNTLAFSTDGSERMRILSGGKVLINATTDRDKWDNSTIGSNLLQVERSVSGGNSSISIATNPGTSADVFSLLFLGRSRGTANNDYTAVASGDGLGAISFQGADGTEFVEAASIRGHVDGTPGANDMPGRLMFFTTPDGSATSTERMRIDSSGNLLVGTTSAVTGSKLVVDTGDATIYGVRVGRGAGAVSTNTAVGYQALNANTTGAGNTTVGYQAGNANQTNSYFVAIGYQAGLNNKASDSLFVGAFAGQANTTGTFNHAVGYAALYNNTTGPSNTAVGYQAASGNTTGGYNVALGFQAASTNSTGNSNVAVGYAALRYNTASANVAVGRTALGSNNTGVNNVAFGTEDSNTGYAALHSNTTGSYNVAIGNASLRANSTGNYNVAVGHEALRVTTSSNNTAVGHQALIDNTTGANNTAVGYQTLAANTTASNNTAVGYATLDANTTGLDNAAVGFNALGANTTGNYNAAFGARSVQNNTTGEYNTGIGRSAMSSNTTGSGNTALGYDALQANSTANNNTAIGFQALFANTTGANNTAVGYGALDSNTTGAWNAVLGSQALQANTTGVCNTAIGGYALYNCTTGSSNIQVGGLEGAGINYNPVFNVTTENNRLVMGHTAITNAYVQVAWTVVSDARDKTNIQPVPHGLGFINQLNPVSFQFKTSREDETPNGNKRYGFLAQDILALEGDDPVIIDTEVPEKLKYQGESLVPVLVKAVQELTARLEAAEAEIATLKGA
jgi:hypothetical protein